uniref:MOSC domain-containing protein n=1 Tax=Rhabditophanes sp. KR3021 TaxID=114890 RepID=A0AC35TRS1_9BILA
MHILSLPVVVLSAVASTAVIVYYFAKKTQKQEEDVYEEVGKIQELFLYPVKSMRAIKVPYIELTRIGGQYGEMRDRSFMVVNRDTNKFVSSKFERLLSIITPSIKNGTLTLENKGKTVEVVINDVVAKGDVVTQKVFGEDKCEGFDCGDEVGLFIKEALNVESDMRLVYHSDSLFKQRITETGPQFSNVNVEGQHTIRYQDDAPYMMMTVESIQDLNNRIGDEEMVVERFRPSIYVSDAKAYDEDYWAKVKINNVTLTYLKPCTRCVQTLINPDTGVSNKNLQPLKELRKYRLAPGHLRQQYKESPVLGAHFAATNGGIIRIGDSVSVVRKTTYAC